MTEGNLKITFFFKYIQLGCFIQVKTMCPDVVLMAIQCHMNFVGVLSLIFHTLSVDSIQLLRESLVYGHLLL